MNDDGDIIAEECYWPELPSSALADALAIQTMLADPIKAAAFKSKLPTNALNGKVSIRHTSLFERSALIAYGSYDVMIVGANGSGYVRHFRIDGTPIALPQELRGASSAPPAR